MCHAHSLFLVVTPDNQLVLMLYQSQAGNQTGDTVEIDKNNHGNKLEVLLW